MNYHTPVFERLAPEKKEKILKIAVNEFASLGYQSANINVIAKKCGISVGALYKYFVTKENLFLSVCTLAVDALKSALEVIINSEGGFFSKVEMVIKIIQQHSRKNPGIIHLYNEVTTQGNRELAGKLSYEMETISAELYARLIEEARQKGEIAPDVDDRMAAFCMDNIFMSLQFSYATEYYQERMKIYVSPDIFEDDERVLRESLKFLKRAFGA
ncbi:MAG: TetR/AcrR family transcriptional regulator [Spirochaetales bacterium]|nr:TetR/AcrR family transcriptional regulator [Spirochaetales bacterium]